MSGTPVISSSSPTGFSSDTGAWALPGGEAYYADAVKSSTTTNYSPQEVHQLGLDQVD